MLLDDTTNPFVSSDNELLRLFQLYLSECKHTKRLSDQTLKGYSEVFSTFQKIVPEVTKTSDLTPHFVSEFFRRIGTRKRKVGNSVKIGIKPSTTSTYYNKLMAFFRWLEKNEYIEYDSISNKIARPATPTYEDERAITDEEVSKLIATITLHTVGNAYLFKRDLLIISLLIYTGIRKGELLGLRVQDVDLIKGTIFVNHQTSKSKNDRTIPIHPTLERHIRSYLAERMNKRYMSTALITSSRKDMALTAHGLKHWVKRYKRISGVSFHLHRCRHTFACTLAKTGVDITSIMRLLGHTSLTMTMRYLRSIKTEDSRDYINKMSF